MKVSRESYFKVLHKKSELVNRGYLHMNRKTHHVVPASIGGWNVKKGGSYRASVHFNTKVDAINAGRKISQHQHSELVIHNRNGRIAQSDSHGSNAFSRRG